MNKLRQWREGLVKGLRVKYIAVRKRLSPREPAQEAIGRFYGAMRVYGIPFSNDWMVPLREDQLRTAVFYYLRENIPLYGKRPPSSRLERITKYPKGTESFYVEYPTDLCFNKYEVDCLIQDAIRESKLPMWNRWGARK